MNRRDAIAALMAGSTAPKVIRGYLRAHACAPPDFAAIERRAAGRLGVSVIDTATHRRLMYRGDERFPMCSTFKWLLAAQVLARVDAGKEELARSVPYSESDLLEYAPITRAHVRSGGMAVGDLAAAAVEESDNTAGNLLLRTVGGPMSFTSFLRRIGDSVSRLDRIEPALNNAKPTDTRDTTTPNAMIADMQQLLLGTRLRSSSRERLLTWLVASKTGADRLRAGLPTTWQVGDKTGTGAHGATSDVAIVWPVAHQPVLVAAYIRDSTAGVATRNAALADVGRAVAAWIERSY